MIVLIGGEKGGTGKSTIAECLACMAARDGADLVVVDTDSQRTVSKFCARRFENGFEPYIPCMEKVGGGKALSQDLINLASKYDLVIVDAGGRDSRDLRFSMLAADELYTPVRPVQNDLETLSKMDTLIEEAQIVNPDLRAHVILNQCPTNRYSTDAHEAREYSSSFDNMKVLNSEIKLRWIYSRISRGGVDIKEAGGDRAAFNEMTNLYKEIFYG